MQIESGTTTWWRNRHLLWMVILLAFAGWFGYDGLIKYPAANRGWASQAIGAAADDIRINPRVQRSTINEINAELAGRSGTFEELLAIHRQHLGEPSYQKDRQTWWVGPAMYVLLDPAYSTADPATGKLIRWRQIAEPTGQSAHNEGEIRKQKWCAFIVLVAAAAVALKLLRVMTTRVVLDDAGLRYNSKSISWEAMTGLRISDFERKSWVDLEYTAGDVTRSRRLDSFHIEKFNEIVGAICERKGFASPMKAGEAKQEQGEQGGTGPEV